MDIIASVVIAPAAYLLGSTPTGYLAGLTQGIDIRTKGSGNIGATNVFRILGKKLGTLVLVVDGLKGWAAVALLPFIVLKFLPPTQPEGASGLEILKIIAGFGAILGHNYTCWLKFKGGKGIATSAGVLGALMPYTLAVAVSLWIIMALITRYVSVASIAAAAVLPFAAWFFGRSPRIIAVALLMGALAIYKHKANIQRLMAGTENRIGGKKPPPEDKKP